MEMNDELTPKEEKDIMDQLEETLNGPEEQIEEDGEKSELLKLKAELEEAKDKYLRLFAEFDNFRKRTTKERLDLMKTASQETIIALLPVVDDFNRAKKASELDNATEQFSEGVNLVYNKFISILESRGLRIMESNGEVFDVEKHEALTELEAPSPDNVGIVLDTIENGYYLYDKIIRYAKVVVGK